MSDKTQVCVEGPSLLNQPVNVVKSKRRTQGGVGVCGVWGGAETP